MHLTPYRYIIEFSLDEALELGRVDLLEADQQLDGRPVEDAVEHRLRQAEVRRFVDNLPARDQYVVRSAYWEGRTQQEIAAELGVSQPAVSQQLRRVHRAGSSHLAHLVE